MKHTIIAAVLLTLGAGVAEAKKKPAPYVTADTASADRCTPDDPKGPCPGRRLVVRNPTRWHVDVVVGCEGERLEEEVSLPPRRSAVLDLGSGNGALAKGQCGLVSWRRR